MHFYARIQYTMSYEKKFIIKPRIQGVAHRRPIDVVGEGGNLRHQPTRN